MRWFIMDKEELNGYLCVKFIESYMYNEEFHSKVRKGKFDDYILNSDFVDIFIEFVNDFCEHEMLELSKRNEIYDLIIHVAQKANFADFESRKYYVEKLNELIRKLNTLEDRNAQNFYEQQIGVRLNLSGKEITYEEYEKYKEIVQDSLGYDFIFLINHTDLISSKDFEIRLDSFVGDNYYFYSLNGILQEKPELLKDQTFKKRLKQVIDSNRHNRFRILVSNIDDKRFVLSQNSKFRKQLKEE